MGRESKWYIIRVLDLSFGSEGKPGDLCAGRALTPLPQLRILLTCVPVGRQCLNGAWQVRLKARVGEGD